MANRILILGASGMLGSTLFRYLSAQDHCEVVGTLRSNICSDYYNSKEKLQLITGVDVENLDILEKLFLEFRPDVVINCVGLVKQLDIANDPLIVLPINSILPHRLAKFAKLIEARLIHISTDCVFSGDRGGYEENDFADARDLYGRSKFIGEVAYAHTITLRTSIIGHEINKKIALINWFLSQKGPIFGYKNAIFSGLPTVEVASIILNYVLPKPNLSGVYHLASSPINKYDLLKLVASEYKKDIQIIPDDTVKINRSLNAEKFNSQTGYKPPSWPILIKKMHEFG